MDARLFGGDLPCGASASMSALPRLAHPWPLGAGQGAGETGQEHFRGACAVQMRSCWTSVLARTRSFRITAVRATFGGFPFPTSASYLRLRLGFCWTATSAGM